MIRIKKVAIFICIVAFGLLPTFAFAFQTPRLLTVTQQGLSGPGQGAFEDLARCVHSEDSSNLNIFFLIDSSASLRIGDNGGPGSDPNNLRAEILSETIRQLNTLNQKIRVNFALDTFDSTSPGTGSKGNKKNSSIKWTPADTQQVNNAATWVEKNIPKYDYGQRTNWLAGLENARNQLSNAPRGTGQACQAIIWFTDGGLDVDGTTNSNANAIDQLCGLTPNSTQPGARKGIISALRASDISLIGVLLSPDKGIGKGDGIVSYFRPIVEGTGEVDASTFGGTTSQGFECGQNPIPSSYARGAMLVASNPDDLAFLFASIPYFVSNGQAIAHLKPNEFTVDPGIVSAAVVISAKDWQLFGPGISISNSTSNPSFDINTVGNISTVEFKIPKNGQGNYRVDHAGSTPIAVFLESGVHIKLDGGLKVSAGSGAQDISGTLVDFNDKPVEMGFYDMPSMRVTSLDTSGQNRDSQVMPLRVNSDGKWSGQVLPFDGAASAEMHISLQLVTSKSKIKLPEISQTFTLPLLIPDKYCTVNMPASGNGSTLMLSDLVYKKSPASGTFTITGAKTGNCSVKISAPVILSDILGRGPSDFNISVAEAVSAKKSVLNSWIVIPENKKIEFEIGVNNSDNRLKANGETLLSLPVAVQDQAATQSIESAVRIGFNEVVPEHNKILLIILLTLIGLAIPLALLQLVDLRAARYKLDNIRLASVPVRVRIDGNESVVTMPDGSLISLQDRNFDYLPSGMMHPRKFVSDFKGKTLAAFESHLPLNPFGNVEGLVKAPAGSVIVTSESSRTDHNGTQAPVSLNLNRLFFATTEIPRISKVGSTTEKSSTPSAFDDDFGLSADLPISSMQADSPSSSTKDGESFEAQLSIYLNLDTASGAKLLASVLHDINASQLWIELSRLRDSAGGMPSSGVKNKNAVAKNTKKDKTIKGKAGRKPIEKGNTIKEDAIESTGRGDSPKSLLDDPDDPWA